MVLLWRKKNRRINRLGKQVEKLGGAVAKAEVKLAWPIQRTISADLQALKRIPVPFHTFNKMILGRTAVNQFG